MKKIGYRIWYGIAIFLSGLILLVSVLGIAGIWIAERRLANSVDQVIDAVENATGSLRQAIQGFDGKLESMQAISTYVSTVSSTLSDNINDQGLIKLLLPPEQEQNLTAMTTAVVETNSSLRDSLLTGITIYRSIDQLPLVNLPHPNPDQVSNIEEVIGEVQTASNNLEAGITAFRSNVNTPVNKVGTAADNLTSRLSQARDRLAQLDARLVITLERLDSLKQSALRILVLFSILITLWLAWVIYSQVEVIRLYVLRWKASGQKTGSAEFPAQTGGNGAAAEPETVSLPLENQGEGKPSEND